jgi:hypothetical protein
MATTLNFVTFNQDYSCLAVGMSLPPAFPIRWHHTGQAKLMALDSPPPTEN